MAVEIDFGKDCFAVWVAKRTQVGSTIVPKIDLGGILGVLVALGVALGGQDRKMTWGTRFFWSSWDRLGLVLGAVLGLSWAFWGGPGVQDGIKIEKNLLKIDRNFDVSWNQLFNGFDSIFEWKMKPSWFQNRIKNRYQLRKADFPKVLIKPIEF